jgi:hypothetical protein
MRLHLKNAVAGNPLTPGKRREEQAPILGTPSGQGTGLGVYLRLARGVLAPTS